MSVELTLGCLWCSWPLQRELNCHGLVVSMSSFDSELFSSERTNRTDLKLGTSDNPVYLDFSISMARALKVLLGLVQFLVISHGKYIW